MNTPLQVKDDIFWVGSLDFHLRVFDIIMHTQHGTTYNSYIVKGSEKTVLFEVAKENFFDEFLQRVQAVTDPAKIDYIVLNHTEPDHSGSLKKLLTYCPNATVVATGAAIRFVKNIVNQDFPSQTVKEGDTIDIGGKTLQFIIAPFLHWPDSMYTYIPESKTIFTCDSFGCHYCDNKVFNDAIPGDFTDAYKYYYDCIMSPFKSYVLDALDKIKPLAIEAICPGHGPVIRKDPQKYMDMYRDWSTEVKREKPSVVIVYVSAYGYTKKMASHIAEGIKAAGNVDVLLYDLVELKGGKDAMLNEIAAAKGLLIGSPTILGDTLPPIWEVLSHLNPIIHRGKIAGVFGSYGWSGEAIQNIEERLKQLKFQLPVDRLKVCFNPSEEQLQTAFAFGKDFGTEILK